MSNDVNIPRFTFSPDEMADSIALFVWNWLYLYFRHHDKLQESAMTDLRKALGVWSREWLDSMSDNDTKIH